MSSKDELACVYAALILADDGISVTEDKLVTVLKAAGISYEPFWPGLFAKALEGINIKDLITNIGSSMGSGGGGGGGGGGAPPAAAATVEEKKEEKKEEVKDESEESDDDMGFGLFD